MSDYVSGDLEGAAHLAREDGGGWCDDAPSRAEAAWDDREPNNPPSTYETTDRGFKHFEPISTTYGHVVSVYESSAAARPCLWLSIAQTQESMEAARTNIPPESATAHLTIAQAEAVRDALTAAIANHYQQPFYEEETP